MQKIVNCYHQFNQLGGRIPADIALLLSRFAIASVFWRSAQSKISGWDFLGQSWQFFNLNQSALLLFQYEYQLPLLSPELAAYLGTVMEFFLPLFLILGLATRLAGLGLLVITAVIQFLVYPDAWPTHILWLALLVHLLQGGGGRISLDYFLARPRV